VDLERLEEDELRRALPQLASARGVVFDMRGYPRGRGSWQVLNHLSPDTLSSAQWLIPVATRPDRAGREYERSSWPVHPVPPHLSGRLVFLIDGRAISAAETFMGIVEHYRLGTIVGSTTAGTNGNVNPFSIPGGYRIWWTGMKVLKHDGSRHHGVGIRPDIEVLRTIAGVRAGRDEVLERGVAIAAGEDLTGPH
jgi:C-terminal processing protease CtpA/Prc